MTIKLSEIFEEFKMIYPTDEDPQDKVLVKAFNDRSEYVRPHSIPQKRDSTQNDLRFH